MNTTLIVALLTFQTMFQGLYIPSIDASWDVITPLQNGYVSTYPGVMTTYDPGTGAEVLLIHNHLGGARLLEVHVMDKFLYQNTVYVVLNHVEFPAYEPPRTPYPNGYLILQTCIEKDGNPTWGRLLLWAVEVQP